MKIHYLIIIITLGLMSYATNSYSQKCHEFHKSNNCLVEDIEGFKLSSLSRSHNIEVGKTITYEVVLYGNREIIIQCCTEEQYYPLRFKLRSSINGDLIYDNKYDNYITNISLALDRTELISIEITIVSNEQNVSIYKGTKACVGMAIYTQESKVRN